MKKGKRSVAVVFVVLAVLLAALPLAFPSIVVEASYPLERAWCVVKRHVFSRAAGAFSGASARAENIRLKRELAALALDMAQAAEIEAENARLRRALHYIERTEYEYLAAPVLSRGGGAAAAHDVLRVGKGSLAGVREGAVVVVPQGLVGRVVSVTLHTCEVKLITDPSLKVACMSDSLGGGRLYGILCGGGEDSLSLKYLSGSTNLPERTRIITSGEGGVFPAGIEVGVYLSEGSVLPSVVFSALEDVFIRCAE